MKNNRKRKKRRKRRTMTPVQEPPQQLKKHRSHQVSPYCWRRKRTRTKSRRGRAKTPIQKPQQLKKATVIKSIYYSNHLCWSECRIHYTTPTTHLSPVIVFTVPGTRCMGGVPSGVNRKWLPKISPSSALSQLLPPAWHSLFLFPFLMWPLYLKTVFLFFLFLSSFLSDLWSFLIFQHITSCLSSSSSFSYFSTHD